MKALTMIGAAGVSFAAGWFFGLSQAAEDADGSVATEAIIEEAGDPTMVKRLQDRLDYQAARIASLERSLEEANTRVAAASEASLAGAEARENPFRRQAESRIERRVEALAERLGLTELQKAGLREVFLRRLENFASRRSGEEVAPFNLDAELEAVLSPEQFAGYMEETQEDIYNRAELIATGQLVRMNQLLELDEAVQGRVYEAVHVTAQEMMIARETGASYSMREALDERLGTVLTEDQLKVLREEGAGFGAGPGMGSGFGPGGRGP